MRLEPGERRTLTFEIGADQLGFYDRELRFVVEPGPVAISVGTSALDLSGTAQLDLVGPTVIEPVRRVFSAVTVS